MAEGKRFRDCEECGVTVREHLESRIAAVEKAIALSAEVLAARLDAMNGFRSQLREQATTFMVRSEFEILHNRVADDIRTLRESRAELQGKASQTSVMVLTGVSLLAVLLSAAALIHDMIK